MFEDIDNGVQKKVEVTADSNDRSLVYAIWARNPSVGMTIEDAWRLLAERYPEDARFLLLSTYEELVGERDDATWTPSKFLGKVRSVLDQSGGRLNPEVRDLITLAEDDLHPLAEADASHLQRIRARVSIRTVGDPTAARKRLQRLSTDVVRELHDRTSAGKALGRPSGSIPVAAAQDEWKTQLAAAKGARAAYAATAKVQAGDVVEHPKFGPGVVLGVEPGRANILFESGPRKLIAG